MLSLFILIFSGAALVRFAIIQWRSIWLSAAGQPLSDSLHTATGIDPNALSERDFSVLIGHYNQLYPGATASSSWLKEVTRYYRLLAIAEKAFNRALPAIASWSRIEMKRCTRYMAVSLDHHLVQDFDRRASVVVS